MRCHATDRPTPSDATRLSALHEHDRPARVSIRALEDPRAHNARPHLVLQPLDARLAQSTGKIHEAPNVAIERLSPMLKKRDSGREGVVSQPCIEIFDLRFRSQDRERSDRLNIAEQIASRNYGQASLSLIQSDLVVIGDRFGVAFVIGNLATSHLDPRRNRDQADGESGGHPFLIRTRQQDRNRNRERNESAHHVPCHENGLTQQQAHDQRKQSSAKKDESTLHNRAAQGASKPA